MNLAEAALLAGVVAAPNAYSPIEHPQAALDRRAVVLNRMVDAGTVTAEQAQAAENSPLELDVTDPKNGCADAAHPFFCSYVLAEVADTPSLGPDRNARIERLLTGGLTLRTTLDPRIQEAAEDAVAEHIDPTHDIGVAIATTEPGTGAVRAIALNRDWGEGRGRTTLNYALDQVQGGSRGFQAGSTFKPFVLAAAAQKGIEADLDLNSPSEATFSGFRHCETNRRLPSYDVGNYDGEGFGTIDMREATARSVNTYFVQLAERIGTCRPPQVAEDLGVRRADGRPLSRVPAFALGVDEVSPLRMAEAYATFAADGLHCPSHAIVEIATREGATLPLPERRCVQALTKQEAATVTGLLERVIDGPDDERTGAKMSLGLRPAAGKTGTTDNAEAVWFTGYTRQLAAAVWAGYPDENRALKKVRIRGEYFKTLFGGALPGPIWREAMKAAHEGVEIERLERELPDCTDPEGDVERARCPDDLEGKGKRDGDDRDDTNDEDDEDD